MKIRQILVAATLAVGLSTVGAIAPAAAVPWGDTTGQQTYVPAPTYIDDCGTKNDRILVGNTSRLTWWVYKNADGTRTASVAPKPGYWIDVAELLPDGTWTDGAQTVWDFPAFTSTCTWIDTIPQPTRTGAGPYDFAFPSVPGGSWRLMVVTGGTKVWLQPNIGYGIPAGVTSSWVL